MNIKKHLIAPGPTQIPEDVRLVMAQAPIHHRGPEFTAVMSDVSRRLRWLFQTEHPVLCITSSGTGGFEAVFTNFTKTGDKILMVGGGKFSERWGRMADTLSLDVVRLPVEWGEAVEPDAVAALLKAHPDVSMLTMCASETSTGVFHPVDAVVETVRRIAPDVLVAVDGITAVGIHDVPMDKWDIDILVSGSQKAFSLPPGLSLIAANDRAWNAAETCDHGGFYFDLPKEREAQSRGQTAYTPATSLIIGLQRVLEKFEEEGLPNLFARHARLALATQAGLRAIGCTIFADVPAHGVTMVRVPDGIDAPTLGAILRDHYGVTIAGGQNQLKPDHIRVGHMGFMDWSDVLIAIGAIEQALVALGADIKLGAGLTAAQNALRKA